MSRAAPPSKGKDRQSVDRESSDEKIRIGQRFGKYKLTRLIGLGGMAQSVRSGRYAAKPPRRCEVSHRIAPPAVHRRRTLHHEAQVAGRLNHLNIIAIYDIGFEHDTHYIAMELLNPGSAGSFIKQKAA